MATFTVTSGLSPAFVSGDTVTPAKLNSLGTPTIAISAIQTADISDAQITSDKLATGAVTGAAGGGKIAASAITGQTTIADPLADTDEFLVHDASASALRKVAYSAIAPTVTAAKLDGVAKDGSGNNLSAGTAPIFGCRAWVNFDGTKDTSGAASTANTNRLIIASGNVASVLRNGTGDYTITFTTAMPDEKYSVVFGAGFTGGAAGTGRLAAVSIREGNPVLAASCRITTQLANGSANQIDVQTVTVSVFR